MMDAQTQNFSLSGASQRQSAIDLGGGNTFFACWRTDIVGVELLWTDQDQVTTNARSYQLSSPEMFMYDAGKLNDGFVVGGHLYNYPYLLKTDVNGDFQWLSWITDLAHNQDAVIAVLSNDTTFSLYTYPGGTYSNGIYRIEGSSAGTTYTGVEITTDSANFRIYDAIALADPTQHLLAGAGYHTAGSFNLKAVLMQVNDTGGVWMNLYDMDTTTSNIQDAMAVAAASGGGYLCAGTFTSGSAFSGFVFKVDATGDLIWARRYAIPGTSLQLTAVIELPNGDILAAGLDNSFTGRILHLDAAGGILWQGRFAAGGGYPSYEDGFFYTDLGDLKLNAPHWLIGFDPDGKACGYDDVFDVVTTALTPQVTPIEMTNSSFVPAIASTTHTDLTPSMTWALACTYNSIGETHAAGTISAHPVPTSGMVFLGEAGQVLTTERVMVRDLAGSVLYDGPYARGIDLTGLKGGCYVIQRTGSFQRALVVKE